MQNEKIYAFKGYGNYYFYNNHDLNTFDSESLEWNGGKWLISSYDYIICSHLQNLQDKGMIPLSGDEFDSVKNALKYMDKDFSDYLDNCKLCNGEPIEKLFNKTIKDIDITEYTDLEDLPYNAIFWDCNPNGEPITYTMTDFENSIFCCGNNSEIIGHYKMIY